MFIIIVLTIIVFLMIGILMIAYNFEEYDNFGHNTKNLFWGLFGLLVFVVTMYSAAEMILSGTETNDIDDIVLEYKVVSVNTGQEGSGRFFIGSGSYRSNFYYYVRVQTGETSSGRYIYELIKINSNVSVIEDNSREPGLYKIKTHEYTKLFGIIHIEIFNGYRGNVLVVPEGSIIVDVFDLEIN